MLGVAMVVIWRNEYDRARASPARGAIARIPSGPAAACRWSSTPRRPPPRPGPASADRGLRSDRRRGPDAIRATGIRSGIGAPIVVDGDLGARWAPGRGGRGAGRGHRGSARRVHGAPRHGDLEHREPGGAAAAGRRAGRAAARRDAGRPRRAAGGGLHRGRARGRPAARRRPRARGALRGRRHGDRRSPRGAAAATTPGRHAGHARGRPVRGGSCSRPGDRRGWTATRTPPGARRLRPRARVSARRSAPRSSSKGGSGAR